MHTLVCVCMQDTVQYLDILQFVFAQALYASGKYCPPCRKFYAFVHGTFAIIVSIQNSICLRNWSVKVSNL